MMSEKVLSTEAEELWRNLASEQRQAGEGAISAKQFFYLRSMWKRRYIYHYSHAVFTPWLQALLNADVSATNLPNRGASKIIGWYANDDYGKIRLLEEILAVVVEELDEAGMDTSIGDNEGLQWVPELGMDPDWHYREEA